MARKMNKTAALFAAAFFAFILILQAFFAGTAYALKVKPLDWDKYAPDGVLKESATDTEYAVLIDAKTGKVLYAENADEIRFPASITKIMTCLLVIENAEMDDLVTIMGVQLTDSKATAIGVQDNEIMTVRELLYGLMLPSGNDAALALAMHVAGSESAFANMMNQRAQEIGMTGTNFMNPHGLHDDNHYSTAMDMAKLAYVAMQNPIFREIVSTFQHTPEFTNIHNAENLWPEDVWENTNKLISTVFEEKYSFDDKDYGKAIGIKTGYTGAAKSTLVSAAQSADGTQEVIAVVLYGDSTKRFTDSINMFLYAFEYYDTLDLSELLADKLTLKTHVENAKDTTEYDNLTLNAVRMEGGYVTDTNDMIAALASQPERFTFTQSFTRELTAPIAQGEKLGTLSVYLDGGAEPVMVCELVAANDVEAMPEATPTQTPAPTPVPATPTPVPTFMDIVNNNLKYIVIGIAALLIIIVTAVLIRSSGRYKKSRHSSYSSARGSRDSRSERGRRTDQRYSGGSQRGRGRRR